MLVNPELLAGNLQDNDARYISTYPVDFEGIFAPKDSREILAEALGGKDVHFVTGGRWSMYDMLEQALSLMGSCKLWLSTFSITEYSARQLVQHLETNRLLELHMLVDYRAKVRYPEVYQLAEHNASAIKLAPCHAKVMILESETKALAMQGSANWTENPRLECGYLSTSRAVVNFYKDFLNRSIEHGHPFDR